VLKRHVLNFTPRVPRLNPARPAGIVAQRPADPRSAGTLASTSNPGARPKLGISSDQGRKRSESRAGSSGASPGGGRFRERAHPSGMILLSTPGSSRNKPGPQSFERYGWFREEDDASDFTTPRLSGPGGARRSPCPADISPPGGRSAGWRNSCPQTGASKQAFGLGASGPGASSGDSPQS